MSFEGGGRPAKRAGTTTGMTRGLLIYRLASAAVVVLLSAGAAPAQEQQAALTREAAAGSAAPADSSARLARKVDEFGRVGGCDHSARLDNLAIELQNAPDSLGYLIVYGPAGKANGSAHFRGDVTKNYLVNSRGIEPDRLVVVNGGRYKEMTESFSELWLVPPGAEPPAATAFEHGAATFKGLFAEYETTDGPAYYEYDVGTGPPAGHATFAGFVDAVSSQPETRAYLVAYNGERSAPGAWRRAAEGEVEELKQSGIGADRFSVVFGGYAKELKLQLWVLPADAPPPVADAGAERPPVEATSIGGFDRYALSQEGTERFALKGLGDVLKADETLTAYIFVRGELPGGDAETAEADEASAETADKAEGEVRAEADATGQAEGGTGAAGEAKAEAGTNGEAKVETGTNGEAAAGGEGEAAAAPAELKTADLVPLAERWKAELREKYGVAEHRVVVFAVAPRGEWDTDTVETWVVPPGAAPPDPYAEPQAEEETGEEPVEETNEGATDNGSDSSDPDRPQAVRRRTI